MRALVVEDDGRIAGELAGTLREQGYVVQHESDGEAGYRAGLGAFAVIVLDLGLPSMDGLDVLRRWRGEGIRTPVLALTARGSWMERVKGLDAGADDYLPKPFQMAELLARLRAIVRRGSPEPTLVFRSGELVVDTRLKRVTCQGREVSLTPQEFKAVSHLLASAGRVVSASELIEVVHRNERAVTGNAIEAMIGRVRRKLGVDVIETRRGFGYLIPDDLM